MKLGGCKVIILCLMSLFLGAAGKLWAQALPVTPDNVRLIESLPFCSGTVGGRGKVLYLDIAQPKGQLRDLPVVLLVHGGGWVSGSRHDYRRVLLALAQQDRVAVSIDYRLAPGSRFPAQLEDVKCAVRWIRAHAPQYQMDTRYLVAVGGSAGAHLVALLGTTAGMAQFEGQGGFAAHSSHIDAMVLHGGPYDLLPLSRALASSPAPQHAAALDAVVQLMGASHQQDPQAYLNASPTHYASARSAPALFLHGAKDPVVPARQAQEFDALLRARGVRSEAMIIEGAGHGDFGDTPDVVMERFIAFVRGAL